MKDQSMCLRRSCGTHLIAETLVVLRKYRQLAVSPLLAIRLIEAIASIGLN
ncbi:MAG: hypothetical protein KA714_18970 [Limnoraphis sp. WC205]|jgi:hypothetical protein|nr:hypothetical protein [Limnoraphis sp. WC205]